MLRAEKRTFQVFKMVKRVCGFWDEKRTFECDGLVRDCKKCSAGTADMGESSPTKVLSVDNGSKIL